jgi:hypothetical protein
MDRMVKKYESPYKRRHTRTAKEAENAVTKRYVAGMQARPSCIVDEWPPA